MLEAPWPKTSFSTKPGIRTWGAELLAVVMPSSCPPTTALARIEREILLRQIVEFHRCPALFAGKRLFQANSVGRGEVDEIGALDVAADAEIRGKHRQDSRATTKVFDHVQLMDHGHRTALESQLG